MISPYCFLPPDCRLSVCLWLPGRLNKFPASYPSTQVPSLIFPFTRRSCLVFLSFSLTYSAISKRKSSVSLARILSPGSIPLLPPPGSYYPFLLLLLFTTSQSSSFLFVLICVFSIVIIACIDLFFLPSDTLTTRVTLINQCSLLVFIFCTT